MEKKYTPPPAPSPSSRICFRWAVSEDALLLDGVWGLLLGVRRDGQHHLHFVAGGRVGELVDLGKTLADGQEGLIFGLRQDGVQIGGGGDANGHEHQEGKGLQLLLREQKRKRVSLFVFFE